MSKINSYRDVVIILDQAVGQLRLQDRNIFGIDLRLSSWIALEYFRKAKLHIIMIVQDTADTASAKSLNT